MASISRRGSTVLPATTIERYFTLHAGVGLARRADSGESCNECEDVYVARHHNGICVVCLSPQHPAVVEGSEVVQVEFRPASRQVVGKKKRGGVFLEPDSRLATITTKTGISYTAHAAVRGILVETNLQLREKPGLVSSHPLTNGYLAVVLPRPTERNTATDHLKVVD